MHSPSRTSVPRLYLPLWPNAHYQRTCSGLNLRALRRIHHVDSVLRAEAFSRPALRLCSLVGSPSQGCHRQLDSGSTRRPRVHLCGCLDSNASAVSKINEQSHLGAVCKCVPMRVHADLSVCLPELQMPRQTATVMMAR